jgi:hypothetical protein
LHVFAALETHQKTVQFRQPRFVRMRHIAPAKAYVC